MFNLPGTQRKADENHNEIFQHPYQMGKKLKNKAKQNKKLTMPNFRVWKNKDTQILLVKMKIGSHFGKYFGIT